MKIIRIFHRLASSSTHFTSGFSSTTCPRLGSGPHLHCKMTLDLTPLYHDIILGGRSHNYPKMARYKLLYKSSFSQFNQWPFKYTYPALHFQLCLYFVISISPLNLMCLTLKSSSHFKIMMKNCLFQLCQRHNYF